MLKKTIALLALYTSTLCMALDVNMASEAELDGIRGIGPATSRRILAERDKGPFQNWPDFMARVKGIQKITATRYSAQGLTVNGESFASPAAAAPPATDTAVTPRP